MEREFVRKVREFKLANEQQFDSLHIYDFDNTLFNSPHPHPGMWGPKLSGLLIEVGLWFRDARTLSKDFIPDVPPVDWFNEPVIKSLEASLASSSTLTVLVTGRLHSRFYDRIHSITSSLPHKFHMVFCREGEAESPEFDTFYRTTLEFKIALFSHILHAFPGVSTISLWDDRIKHIKSFGNYFDTLVHHSRISSYSLTHVVEPPEVRKHIVRHLEIDLVRDMVNTYNTTFVNYDPQSQEKIKGHRVFKPIDFEEVLKTVPDL